MIRDTAAYVYVNPGTQYTFTLFTVPGVDFF
jgi:hypothetical protein